MAPAVIGQMLSVAEPDHAVRVLDVGCGIGLVGVSLSKLGFVHLDGLDFSSQMLSEARRKGVYRELIQADRARRLISPRRPMEQQFRVERLPTVMWMHTRWIELHIC